MSLFSTTGVAINLAITLSLAGVLGALHGQTAAERDGYARAHQEWREAHGKLERRRVECRERLATEKARGERVGQDLAGLDSAIAAAKAETAKKREAIETQRKALGELRTWHGAAVIAVADFDRELDGLASQLTVERESAESAFAEWWRCMTILGQWLAEAAGGEAILADLEREHQRLLDKKQRLAAWFREVQRRGPGPDGCGPDRSDPPPVLRGRVATVAPEALQCTISVGKNDGVFEGMRFTVSRGDTYVGLVEVQKVLPTMSTARFIVDMIARGKKIEVGDVVRTSFEVR